MNAKASSQKLSKATYKTEDFLFVSSEPKLELNHSSSFDNRNSFNADEASDVVPFSDRALNMKDSSSEVEIFEDILDIKRETPLKKMEESVIQKEALQLSKSIEEGIKVVSKELNKILAFAKISTKEEKQVLK